MTKKTGGRQSGIGVVVPSRHDCPMLLYLDSGIVNTWVSFSWSAHGYKTAALILEVRPSSRQEGEKSTNGKRQRDSSACLLSGKKKKKAFLESHTK